MQGYDHPSGMSSALTEKASSDHIRDLRSDHLTVLCRTVACSLQKRNGFRIVHVIIRLAHDQTANAIQQSSSSSSLT